MVVEATLCEITNEGGLLLQRKSVGRFGEGKWNGPGGKVQPGETPLECVVREVLEETGLKVGDLTHHGAIDFYFGEKQSPDWKVHIYSTSTFTGEPKPSDEGELAWFGYDEIPYAEMWQDDLYWLPPVLQGMKVQGFFVYDENGGELLRHRLTVE
ncbi:MAG: 8-oxo-dGTP diphosphatase [Deltaproteobacteria bacterium]|nr:8-oxo-dGTP diphosphatase [Deltaproteobacteria bacterium]